MKKSSILIILFFYSFASNGQTETDSLKAKTKKLILDKFPATRFLDFQYETLAPSNYTNKAQGKEFDKGNISNHQRFKLALNVPILKKPKWTLSGSLRYMMDRYQFEDREQTPNTTTPLLMLGKKEQFHYMQGSVNYTRFATLFNKPFISNLSLSADGFYHQLGRIYATYIGSMVLKKEQGTIITGGFIIQSSSTALFPILPVMTYYHKFKTSKWQVDAVIPKYVYFRRQFLSESGRLSVGGTFEGEPFYIKPDQPKFDKLYLYNQNEIRALVMYEHHITKYVITTFQAGMNIPMSGTLREKNKTAALIKSQQGMNPFFKVGLSYNLFGK